MVPRLGPEFGNGSNLPPRTLMSTIAETTVERNSNFDIPADRRISAALLTVAETASSRVASVQPAITSEIDQFWNATLKGVPKEPLDPTAELLNKLNPYLKYKVTFRSLGGIPIRTYLAKPHETPGKTPRTFSAFVAVSGHLGDGMGVDLSECQRGCTIVDVCPRSRGDGAQLWKLDGPDFLTRHIASPEGYFHLGVYVDVICAIDYLCSRSHVYANHIGAMGTNQGGHSGDNALAVGALDPRVKAVVARVHFLCDMRRPAAIDGLLVNVPLKQFNPPHSLRKISGHFVDNIIYGVACLHLRGSMPGWNDTVVPLETVQAVYHRPVGIKVLAICSDAAQACPLEVSRERMTRFGTAASTGSPTSALHRATARRPDCHP
jgi:cephalosporin-C deacetylase